MSDQRERDIASLAQAAREILEYVPDPGEAPAMPHQQHSFQFQTPPYRMESPAQIARKQADRLESQSRAVRNLKRELEKWPAHD